RRLHRFQLWRTKDHPRSRRRRLSGRQGVPFMAKKVVLAYSGGLDTSFAIRWLQERGYEVIALTIDLGNEKDLQTVEKRAYEIGAIKALVRDGKKPFIDFFAFPALMAGAVYEGQYLLATAIGRPL